jgi:septal ring factor EnvC (AmiA/AmiB activator)
METYSKELLELDRGTVQYMIDEMQDEIDKQKKMIEQKEEANKKMEKVLDQQARRIRELEAQMKRLQG